MNSRALLCFAALALAGPALRAQGSLTPPGAPAPSMKSLAEIAAKLDARTPIAAVPFTISTPGSYCLAGNLECTTPATAAILITAPRVTLDLGGFALSRDGAGSVEAIRIEGASDVVIRNGSIVGFDYAVNTTGTLPGNRLENLRAVGSWVFAFFVQRAVVTGCTASNGAGDGFAGSGNLFTGCIADTVHNGFNTGPACEFVDCIARGNSLHGFYPSAQCVLRRCVARDNAGVGLNVPFTLVRIEEGTATGNLSGGIAVGARSMVADCQANANTGDGIQISGNDTLVSGCQATGNSAAGINSVGSNNRIDGNVTRLNTGDGIRLAVANSCVVVRNTSAGNGTNFPAAGSRIGPVQSPATATNPFANFND